MLTNYQKFRLIDENKESEFFVEINWDEKDSTTNECKFVRFTFPDGKTAMIRKEHLLGMLFTMGSAEEQMKMIPQKNIEVRWYETVLGIKATKDIHKGEMINVPVKLSIPSREEELIAELKSSFNNKFKN